MSFIALAAMAGILYKIDDKPLDWWTLPIRSNSLISILAAIAKAALILPATESISQLKWLYFSSSSRRLTDLQRFDDASRGPWGSFTFPMHFHFKKPTILASLDCIIIVAALALDSFTQQIISYPSRSITAVGTTASTPSAYAHDAGIVRESGSTFDSESRDDQMQGAIFAGAYGLSSGSLLQCPTGNCTWDPFIPLGVCSGCLNITAECNRSCSPNTEEQTDSVKTCSYTTKDGINLSAESKTEGLVQYTMLNSTVRGGISTTDAKIARSIILQTPPVVTGTNGVPLPKDAEIQQCTFNWCLRDYPAQFMENSETTPVSSVMSSCTLLPIARTLH
ncbi:hypothetical protein IWX90DRAFT_189076 [Phyllosticta citrichinensis]|uniref:Uncharacterized protein n=1 Tax=Phyllosticta citrichinensis TaxID=1130410 RepID=A0ABR1XWR2_9PEZI